MGQNMTNMRWFSTKHSHTVVKLSSTVVQVFSRQHNSRKDGLPAVMRKLLVQAAGCRLS